MSQVRDVVLVMCILVLGNPRGSGFWNGEYIGKGMEMGRPVYEQPGTEVDRILSQQGGFQVSEGKRKGAKRNGKREKQKARGLLHNCTVHFIFMYIMNACNCLNDYDCQSIYVCIIIAGCECS